MISSRKQTEIVITNVHVSDDSLETELSDGRTIRVPISWYPRLSHAREEDLVQWTLTGNGSGIHWPKIDEDISVQNILDGQGSRESNSSFERWKAWYESRF